MDNYEQLVDRISASSGLKREEIERKVEAKRAKLSGLVSKEGAAQIVAAELGINFDQERMKISQLVQGMKRANVIGKIVDVYSIRAYNKNGREGKVANLLLADDTSNIKVVLWDVNHIELIEKEKIKKGDVIEISNGGVRNGELHLGSFSDLKKSKESMGEVIIERVYGEMKLKDLRPGQSAKIRAFIVQAFQPRYFEVCPTCGKKATGGKCAEHGEFEAKKRALLNLVLDDGTENMRCVLFGEQINKLGLSDEEIFSLDKFDLKGKELLGEERVFSGNVRANELYNTVEFTISDVGEIKGGELIKELEAKA